MTQKMAGAAPLDKGSAADGGTARRDVAVVTGAGGGIGLAIGLRLARAGFHVVRIDRDAEVLSQSAEAFLGQGYSVTDLCVDVSDEAQVLGIPERMVQYLPALGCLVNNAAISPRDAQKRKIPILSLDLATWEKTLSVNLTGAFLMCRTLLPFMAQRGGGRVINIASLGGRTAMGDLTTSAYGVSKAGLIGFTRILAREMAPQGITANVVCPGRIATNMAAVADAGVNSEYLARTPLGRYGTPEEVAEMVAYLAGEQAGFVTGACLDINGGIWMG